MLIDQILYGLCGIVLFTFGLRIAFSPVHFLRRLLAINVAGAGLFLLLLSVAYRGFDQAPDAVPHALVLTGIVVAFSATALAVALARQLQNRDKENE